jgi:hypothetical protein
MAKIQALLVFCLGFVYRQKPNVLECAVGFFSMAYNGSAMISRGKTG